MIRASGMGSECVHEGKLGQPRNWLPFSLFVRTIRFTVGPQSGQVLPTSILSGSDLDISLPNPYAKSLMGRLPYARP
jgi:hypothetical protein